MEGILILFSLHKNDAQTFRPEEYFDPKAIENKKALNLPLYDWYDLPVIPEFIQEVKSKSDSLGYTLRCLMESPLIYQLIS